MQVDDKRELLEVGREHLERDQATKRGGCALAPIEELDPEVVVAGIRYSREYGVLDACQRYIDNTHNNCMNIECHMDEARVLGHDSVLFECSKHGLDALFTLSTRFSLTDSRQ